MVFKIMLIEVINIEVEKHSLSIHNEMMNRSRISISWRHLVHIERFEIDLSTISHSTFVFSIHYSSKKNLFIIYI